MRWLALLAVALQAPQALAESRPCAVLKAQIARAETGGSARYRAAAAKQQTELSRATNYSRSIGCDRQQFLFFGEPPPPQCGALASKIAQMQANFAALQQRAGGDEGRKALLQAKYDTQCADHSGDSPSTNFFEQLFGNGRGSQSTPDAVREVPTAPDNNIYKDPEFVPNSDETIVEEGPKVSSEAVCVRRCDGGFFPVSYSAKRSNIDELDTLCKALCPNAEAEIYTKSPWRDIETAFSKDGDAYTNHPNALKFQKTLDRECSCKAPDQGWAEALVEAERLLAVTHAKDAMVTPEEAEQMSRPAPVVAENPRSSAKPTSRREARRVGAEPAAEEGAPPQSIGPAQGQVREEIGPDGARRRVRDLTPAL